MKKPPGNGENGANILVGALERIYLASILLSRYIQSVERLVDPVPAKPADNDRLIEMVFSGFGACQSGHGSGSPASAFNRLVTGVGLANNEPGAAAPGLRVSNGQEISLGGARVYKGLSSIPEFVRGISEASGRVLAWIGVELAKPSGSLPDNVYVIVKALGDLLASLRRLLPLYNPVTRYLTGLYSIPVALARDLYGMRGRDYVEVEVGDFIVSVEMDTVLDYPAGRELSIVGAANGSVSHELTRLVFLAYKVFGTSDLASFYSGVRDELSAYWRHLRSIEGGNYSLFKARYVESVKGVLSSLCVVCPCDGEPFAASLRDKRYGSMYSRALCGHLDLEGDQILVNGSKFDYRKLIVHLSPLLFTGFAQIRRNRGKVVMAMLDTSKPTVE